MADAARGRSPGRLAFRRLRRNRPAWIGLWILVGMTGGVLSEGRIAARLETRFDETRYDRKYEPPAWMMTGRILAPLDEIWETCREAFQTDPAEARRMIRKSATRKVFHELAGTDRERAREIQERFEDLLLPEEPPEDVDTFLEEADAGYAELRETIREWVAEREAEKIPAWLGTDEHGRDVLVRALRGGKISLAVGFVATFVSLVIGVTYGAVAGYLGGARDAVMMRFVDILYGLPYMFFVILLVSFFKQSLLMIFIALGAVQWLTMARIVRGQVLSLKHKEFVEGSRALGARTGRILFRHIVPNLIGPVIVYTTLTIPRVILVESFLSFLGLGVMPPEPSWGSMVRAGATQAAMEHSPWLLIVPGVMMSVTLLAFNFVGDGLRDAFDPRTVR